MNMMLAVFEISFEKISIFCCYSAGYHLIFPHIPHTIYHIFLQTYNYASLPRSAPNTERPGQQLFQYWRKLFEIKTNILYLRTLQDGKKLISKVWF